MASLGKPWQALASLGKPWQALASLGKPWQALASLGKPLPALASLSSLDKSLWLRPEPTLHHSGAHSRADSVPSGKHYSRLGRLARDKHDSLLQTFVNYGCKKFHKIGPRMADLPINRSSLASRIWAAKYGRLSLNSLAKIKLAGQNLGIVFKFRHGQ